MKKTPQMDNKKIKERARGNVKVEFISLCMFEHIWRRDRMDDENMGFISTKTRRWFHNNNV